MWLSIKYNKTYSLGTYTISLKIARIRQVSSQQSVCKGQVLLQVRNSNKLISHKLSQKYKDTISRNWTWAENGRFAQEGTTIVCKRRRNVWIERFYWYRKDDEGRQFHGKTGLFGKHFVENFKMKKTINKLLKLINT